MTSAELAAAQRRIEELEHDNARLLAETKEALERQTATAEILRVIADSRSEVRPVLDVIAENAARFCLAEDATVLLISGSELRAESHYGVMPTTLERPDAAVPRGIPLDREVVASRALLERRVIQVEDIFTEEASYPITAARAREFGWRTMLVAPLIRDENAIGVILLRRAEVRPFTPKQVELLRTFADQAVVAIENVRLFNETKEGLERQTAIAEILKVMSASPDSLGPIFEAVASSARQFCRAEDASVIVRLDGDILHVAAHAGDVGRLDDYSKVDWPMDRGSVSGRAMIDRRLVHVRDLLAEPDHEYPRGKSQASQHPHRTTLAVPLVRDDHVLGALLLRRSEVRPFSERQIDLVQTFASQAVIAIENVRLFNETKEALEQQTSIAEVLKTISQSAFDLDRVLAAVVENAARLAGAHSGFIFRHENGQIAHAASYGMPDEIHDRGAAEFAVDRTTLAGRVVMSRSTVEIADAVADAELMTQLGAQQAELGFRAMLGVPIMRDDAVIGVLSLRRNELRPFNGREVALVRTFADQAAIAIENVRLFNETKEALERQTATAEILRLIAASPTDVQPVLDGIARSAARFCATENVTVALLEAGHLRGAAAHGPLPGQLDRVWPADRTSVSGRAVTDRKTIHVADLQAESEDEYPTGKAIAREFGHRTVLATPLLREGIALGGLLLRRDEVRPFTPQQVELAETFAAQAVIAIENVRLFNETKEALQQQTATSEVLQAISRSAFDLQSVLDTVVGRAAELCGAEQAWMRRIEDGDFKFVAYYGASGELRDMFEEIRTGRVRDHRRIDNSGMGGRAVRERRPIHVHDVTSDPELRDGSLAKRGGARTALAVPMLRDGEPIGAIVVARNLVAPFTEREIRLVETFADQAVIATENVRLFNEIRDKSQQLEVASRHKSEFLANMSHELRTPLNAIIGFSEVLLQGMFGEVNAKQREYLGDVLASGRHLLSLINDILDLAKIEAGRVELELAEFSLPAALENGLTMVRERAARQGIKLELSVGSVDRIVADERKVKQIVFNLLSNAVKFTREGGRVAIQASSQNGEVRVAVRDTGIGIDAADQERIFEEFQQAGRDPERSREGTGLGLALARRYVELHGGRIWVSSEPGRGSTFTFALPLRKEG